MPNAQILTPILLRTSDEILLAKCTCARQVPGYCCPLCNSTGWKKQCKDCGSSGLTIKNHPHGGTPKKENCGWCNGRGWVPANMRDARQANELVEAERLAELERANPETEEFGIHDAANEVAEESKAESGDLLDEVLIRQLASGGMLRHSRLAGLQDEAPPKRGRPPANKGATQLTSLPSLKQG